MEKEINGIPCVSFDFYPSYFVLNNDPNLLLSNPYLTRTNIWAFKEGRDQSWPQAIAEHMISQKLQTMPHVDRTKLTLVCPAASTKEAHTKRFQFFACSVSNHLNLHNGFDHIKILNEKAPKYPPVSGLKTVWDMEHDLQFDADFFAGKDIILFDDIITTGDTMRAFIDKLRDLGANPVLCGSLLYTPKVY